MTSILELLKNEKVEWKKLGEVVEVLDRKRKPIKKSERICGDYPYYGANGIQDYVDDYIFDGTFILMGEDGTVMNKDYTPILKWVEESKIWVNNHAHVLGKFSDCYDLKFIYYYLTTVNVSGIVKGIPPKINQANMKDIEIPVPSIETQKKIVEILDKFTNYVTELQSELQSRTKQYTYYRDKLLSEEYLNKITKEMEDDRKLEIVTLGEIGEFTRGNGLQKKDFQEEGKPVIHYGQIYTKYGFAAERVLAYTSDEIFSKLRKAQKNDILIATTSENIEDVGKSVVWLGDEEVGFSGDMYSYSTQQNSKYIAYCFQTNNFQRQKEKRATGAKMIRIHANDMEKFEIPLPPLSLQNKIVKVLDKFQVLLADTRGLLPEEIEKRQKQYEYYREKLLTFDVTSDRFDSIRLDSIRFDSIRFITNAYYDILREAASIVEVDIEDKVEWKMLSDISKEKLSYGSGAKAVTYDGETRYIRITDIDDKGQLKQEKVSPSFAEGKYIVRKGDILFARSGATVGKNYIHLESKQAIYAGYLIKFSADVNKVISKYVYYCVNDSRYEKFVFNMKSNASQPNINAQQYSNFQMLLPPLHVQQHVVNVLDKFDTLVNDIKEGLPKEIKQRQKQYEYWREQLLSFNL